MSNEPAPAKKPSTRLKTLTPMLLTMMTIAILAGVFNAPTMAKSGTQLVGLILIAAVIVLIPVGFVSAELGTGWPHDGGVYLWVREAFGPRMGFLAVFLQWANEIITQPQAFAAQVAIAAFIISPSAATGGWYVFGGIVLVAWVETVVNLFGVRNVGRLATAGTIMVTFLPTIAIVGFAIAHLATGRESNISLSPGAFVPDFGNIASLALIVGAINAFLGLEVTAVFIRRLKHPQRQYPIAILAACVVTVVLLIAVALSIAIAVPQSKLNIVDGLIQSIQYFATEFSLGLVVPIMAAILTIGYLARGGNILFSVATALLASGRYGHLPKSLTKVNKYGSPHRILIVQAAVISVIGLLFVFIPGVQNAFWILIVMTVVMYLGMYLLMYAAAIRLRYSHPDVKRPFRIPGRGNIGMWIVAGGGFVVTLFSMAFSLIPPSQLGGLSPSVFWMVSGGGFLAMIVLPFIIDRAKGKEPAELAAHATVVEDASGAEFIDDTADVETE